MSVDPIGFVPEWTFADRLRKARRTMALSQAQFAAQIGVEAKAYSQWEAGNNKPRDIVEIANRIAGITGVSSAWLLGLNAQNPGPGVPGPGSAVAGTGFEPVTSGLWGDWADIAADDHALVA